ncbi:glycosyltransferase [Tautonia plasticadhaerens]|uniref:MurG-like transferase n=1 Tax=Tautonia plasticadhaerens TaxID=2527974 RepID=A0A518H5S3_9BACT|nr:glycosyltransferase [Tautonia plasticadhaerens]QDV36180.1 MurG-like transferase [Tautonia plasticadhaerens]
MKITILTVGTMGDLRPFVALAVGLKRAGHEVTVATGTDFEGFVVQHGLAYAPLRADFLELVKSDQGKAILRGSPLETLRAMRTTIPPLVRRILDDAWEACRGSECLIYHPKSIGGRDIAMALGIPAFVGLYLPMLVPTRSFPNPILPARSLGGSLNRLSYSLTRFMTLPFLGVINRWRQEVLGLPPRSRFEDELRRDGEPIPVLYAFSPSVIEPPDDWPESVHVNGFWSLEESGYEPPSELASFLESGPPPVYVGFGSMASQCPEEVTRLVVEALGRSGQRGILATGWGGLGGVEASDDILVVDSVPHDWLFPRTAAVVHHGGAGTTAAGLGAGRPTGICPFFGDQPYWGRVVSGVGVGPEPIPQKRLTADRLAGAIRQATGDMEMRTRAQRLGERMRSEDGVGRAVEVIERLTSQTRHEVGSSELLA